MPIPSSECNFQMLKFVSAYELPNGWWDVGGGGRCC